MASLNPSTMVPAPMQKHLDKGYGVSTPSRSFLAPSGTAVDLSSTPGHPTDSSPLSQSAAAQNNGRFNEEWDASVRGSSIVDGPIQRTESTISHGDTTLVTPSRGGTLKKKASLKRTGSLKRSSSRRSSRAGSVRSLALQPDGDIDETRSAFYSPVPTSGNPTEVLANRFQAWRKVLKDIITYFREIQASYDQRSKALLKLSNVINNTTTPPVFLQSGGLDDALQVLRSYHKSCIGEANKSKDIENDVILALTGLRSDLQQKIKEIKNLSADFKNSVDKEMDNTRRAVNELQEGLAQSDLSSAQIAGKKDPYLLRLAADKQVERQIDEENYLHQAYLNLEASGRELEAIVVGEIQKSYNAYAGILKRESDLAYSTIDELRTGPISMPKDLEWNHFIEQDDQFIDPRISIRQAQNIHYPGRDNELAQEVRAGLLERKSKYLKSYTAGWYVLSPTHLHEFKSADKNQAPIMSLYLSEQKLGSHSNEGSSSNKFMLKGRQTGSMHRGHSWVFRCESHDTMLSWYEAIKNLTEKSPQERNAFVRQHARSISGQSARSVSSDGVDDEDEEPYSAAHSAIAVPEPKQDVISRRPEPGGRFPSHDLLQGESLSQRGLQVPLSPSSGSSNFEDSNVKAAAAAAPRTGTGTGSGSGSGQHQAVNDVRDEVTSKREISSTPVVATGGVLAGVGAAHVAHVQEEDKNARIAQYQQEQAALAAQEATTIAAPDMDVAHELEAADQARAFASPDTSQQQQSEHQAALEATVIAAPDAPAFLSNPSYMTGGRSQGDVSAISTLSSTDTEGEVAGGSRPVLNAALTNSSMQSISNLHVPGEYPRAR